MGDLDMGAAMAEITEGLGFDSDGGSDDFIEGELDTTADDGIDGIVDDAVDKATGESGDSVYKSDGGKADSDASGDKAVDKTAPDLAASTVPRTWRPEAAAEWAKVPPIVQAEILKREEDMWNGIEQYKTDAGFGRSMQKVIEPFAKVLHDHKLDPITTVNSLLNAQYQLVYGTPAQKVELFTRMMQDYGISVDHLTGVADLPKPNAEVEGLRAELNSVKSTLTAQQQRDQQAVYEAKSREVHTFAADPKNIHFNAVADDIVRLINADRTITLQGAYDKAVWMNPTTRAAEITRQQAEKDQAAEKERKEQATKAKDTLATTVRSRARSASTAAPLGTMDDTMTATLAAIKAREA